MVLEELDISFGLCSIEKGPVLCHKAISFWKIEFFKLKLQYILGHWADPGRPTEVHARFFFTIKDTSRHHVAWKIFPLKQFQSVYFIFFFLVVNVLPKGMFQECKFYISASN